MKMKRFLIGLVVLATAMAALGPVGAANAKPKKKTVDTTPAIPLCSDYVNGAVDMTTAAVLSSITVTMTLAAPGCADVVYALHTVDAVRGEQITTATTDSNEVTFTTAVVDTDGCINLWITSSNTSGTTVYDTAPDLPSDQWAYDAQAPVQLWEQDPASPCADSGAGGYY